ncbi:hypothetical protein MKK55_06080 [Methylobacterium sp. J-059]|uniref:hypothetical protein n=1 Tax=Methylobacterium sp. J-059 TaxID=2836643 RepID=UPI001FB93642|nr:hypothetical protein [Methylobacterium sp. J-059]MCJ2038527.1 hypothetical protein [Methylobacterium sp. J-059]
MPLALTLGLTSTIRRIATASASVAICAALGSVPARAESAYVAQAAIGASVPVQAFGSTNGAPTPFARSPAIPAPMATPEMAAARGSGQVAQTLQIGNNNHVAHLQTGTGNQSTAGIIGNMNQVGVLQVGNNLHSNIVLLGTQGLNVGVIQPQGSIPVNMLIARLPNGGLLIKR